VRWSTLSILGRQGFQLVFAVLVARLLGPSEYGVISAATVYATLMSLLLDQGISSALIQRRDLDESAPGAAATVNLLLGVLLTVVTLLAAPWVGLFFHEPQLVGVLQLLAIGLLFKAVAISPRSMLLRHLRLESVAAADILGAGIGMTAGLVAAFSGAGAMAFVYLTLLGDGVTAAVLLIRNRGPVPNLRLRSFMPLLGFGSRVFATNAVAYLSRNSDNVLVGRFLGTTALSYYSMGYRILVIPVQLIGQSVNRVMFPAFSRAADDRRRLADYLSTATELLAVVTLPSMALLAVAAPELVQVVLGDRWLPAAPLMTVLAIAGARETMFYLTPALIRATGAAGLNLRFELFSTAVQIAGIVVGLAFGLLGVAIGYAASGFLLVPVLLGLQKRFTGVSIRRQLRSILPALHASAWGVVAYLAVRAAARPLPPIAIGLLGTAAFLGVLLLVAVVVHRPTLQRSVRRIGAVVGARRHRTQGVSA
jgi:PST family polysaccharide transporter